VKTELKSYSKLRPGTRVWIPGAVPWLVAKFPPPPPLHWEGRYTPRM
jgi:hypothetical protein